jgi:hypothetical protein
MYLSSNLPKMATDKSKSYSRFSNEWDSVLRKANR